MKKIFLTIRPVSVQTAILLLRVFSGIFMATHGWSKISGGSGAMASFPDPIGLGGEISYILTVFAEFFCSIFLIFGLFTRIALIPLIITMLVAVLIVHSADPLSVKEHALMFLLMFIVLFLTGPGKYSLDSKIFAKRRQF